MKRAQTSLAIFLLAAAVILLPMLFEAVSASKSQRIHRTILLKFKAEASPADIQKVLREVRANLLRLKGVRNVTVGAQTFPGTPFTHGIALDFENEQAYRAYRADQEHQRTHNQYVNLIEQSQISDIREE